MEIQREQRQKRAGVYIKSVGPRDSGLDSAQLLTSQPSYEPNNLEVYGFDAEIQCDSAGQDLERGTLRLNHLSSTARKASRRSRSSLTSIPTRVVASLETSSENQRAEIVQHFLKNLLKKPMDNDTLSMADPSCAPDAKFDSAYPENKSSDRVLNTRRALRFPIRCASDVTCESAYPAENRLSDKELKARRALRFPRQWQSEEQPDLAAILDPVEEHGFVPIATPNNPSIESVYCEPEKLTQSSGADSQNLAADRTGTGGHRANHDSFREAPCYLSEFNSFRHGFCHPDDSHGSDYRRRATDSDYTYEDYTYSDYTDFQEDLRIDIDSEDVIQKESRTATTNWQSENLDSSELEGAVGTRGSSGLSQQPMPTPRFMNYVERNLERLCKISTASGVELTVITSDAPRIRYAAGHMWFDKEAADDKPNESTRKQAQSEDKPSRAKHILAHLCGCFRVKQEEDTYFEEIAPSA